MPICHIVKTTAQSVIWVYTDIGLHHIVKTTAHSDRPTSQSENHSTECDMG